MGKFSFGLVKTWEDFNRVTGFTAGDVTTPVTKDNIFLAFEHREKLIRIQATLTPAERSEGTSAPVITFKAKEKDDFDAPIPSLSDNPEVIPEPDQIRATNIALHMLMVQGYQGIGLNAEVGSGKTFILGALIAELWRRKWKVLTECFSPYPVVYVTRASIVEQTERVLRDKFGLVLGRHVDVTNIDQLRAKFGERFVSERVVVKDGEERVVYSWRPVIAPALVILDEAHAVKNVDSTQSRILQAYAELTGPHHLVMASATLFTKVIESQVLCVATKMHW